MPSIVVVGDRDSGKTTFLALLYAAQVKSGSDASDAFRFHAAFESLEEISEAFQQLMSGSFPDSSTKEGIRGITFHLGYRKAGVGLLSRLRSRGFNPEASASVHFILLRNLDEEMARFRRGASLAHAALREVLESEAMAILVDSTKLAVKEEERQLSSMGRYDGDVESLVSTLRIAPGRASRGPLAPLVVFTKFDSVDPKALRAAKVEEAPPEIQHRGRRTAYAESLLEYNLPRTMENLRDPDPSGRPISKPSYFFSSVRTHPATEGKRAKVRLRRIGGAGWEPDYSTDEYLALLERVWKIASSARE